MSNTDRPASPSGAEDPSAPSTSRTPAPAPAETASSNRVTIRRAPKFGVFIVGGGVLGLIATFIVVLATMGIDDGAAATNDATTTSADVGFWGLVGYFSLYGVTAGFVVGALLAVFLDWRFAKQAADLTAERLDIQMPTDTPPEPDPTDAPAADDAR